jgi:hypothetical protein
MCVRTSGGLIVASSLENEEERDNKVPPPYFTNPHARQYVVVNPTFVARVVGRIDANAFHLAGVTRQQCFERVEIVALHD